ncbi:dihydrofolate reductase family protein [Alteribacillus bidgolensis]|uniref:Dihydrofolate reductase n=1 Tax=Alteribacillus bidgolensis TaxID=930129 RepID=A0A1G8RLH7_9BACI|nr:dihydrofolate reductase family protein [Alteribacillus bidgolensis]SDJ17848.1 Dihydrofolate reductase [Alteribacillus bidgolensis]
MRKVKMINRVSIDGYFASLNEMTGGMDWFVPDNDVDKTTHEMVKADTLIAGKATFELFEASWPPVLCDPNAPKEMKALAQELTDMRKIVFSETMKKSDWENTEFYSGDITEVVKKLKEEDGSDILIMGSGTVVQQLTKAGLIDEYVFIVTPVIASGGKQLFKEVNQNELTFLKAKSFDSGNVLLHYAVAE